MATKKKIAKAIRMVTAKTPREPMRRYRNRFGQIVIDNAGGFTNPARRLKRKWNRNECTTAERNEILSAKLAHEVARLTKSI